MTRDEAREFVKVVQAYADGKVIQVVGMTGDWNDLEDLVFINRPTAYRIKSEPREWWAVVQRDGHGVAMFDDRHDAAVNNCVFDFTDVVHVREVVE